MMPKILCIKFNQDESCFSVGTSEGFRIYGTDPMEERIRRDLKEGGIGIVELLCRTNYMGLVGGGANPAWAPNRFNLWEDRAGQVISHLEFKTKEIKNIKMTRDRLIIILMNKIIVYTLTAQPQKLASVDTCDNEFGVAALNVDEGILAAPGLSIGQVQYITLFEGRPDRPIIRAHHSALACISLSWDASKLATASEKGTLIRVWDTFKGQLLHEFRRGSEYTRIYSLAWHREGNLLAVTSQKETVHIFKLDQVVRRNSRELERRSSDELSETCIEEGNGRQPGKGNTSRHSSFGFMKDFLPTYFSSEWSWVQAKSVEGPCLACFSQEGPFLIILSHSDASYTKFRFDSQNGGEASKILYYKLFS